jgi:hypothetical protein
MVLKFPYWFYKGYILTLPSSDIKKDFGGRRFLPSKRVEYYRVQNNVQKNAWRQCSMHFYLSNCLLI